jgi:hypothetical protein
MGKNHDSKYIEKFGFENHLKKPSQVSMLSHDIIIESFIQLNTLYEGALGLGNE